MLRTKGAAPRASGKIGLSLTHACAYGGELFALSAADYPHPHDGAKEGAQNRGLFYEEALRVQ